jgi:hypothetical protein
MRPRLRPDAWPARLQIAWNRKSVFMLAPLLAATVLSAGPGLAGAGKPAFEPGRDTMKSRLSDKASDDQRLNDCGVPEDRRGDRRRPAACGAKRAAAGSGERRTAQ